MSKEDAWKAYRDFIKKLNYDARKYELPDYEYTSLAVRNALIDAYNLRRRYKEFDRRLA